MNINKIEKGTELIIELEGRLDTTTSPELEKELKQSLSGVTSLILDMDKLDYISSAGLRVLLSAQKEMNKQGSMLVKNVNENIMEIFDVTGFVELAVGVVSNVSVFCLVFNTFCKSF